MHGACYPPCLVVSHDHATASSIGNLVRVQRRVSVVEAEAAGRTVAPPVAVIVVVPTASAGLVANLRVS